MPSATPATTTDEDVRSWVGLAMEAAEDKLASDTEAFYVGDVMGLTEWFIVTSGGNPRQVRAITDNIEEHLSLTGGPKPVKVEGKDTLSWVLMDYGDFIVHVFSDEARGFYELERLWSDVPRFERAEAKRA